LQLRAIIAHVITRDTNVAVIGLANLYTIAFNNVSTAALKNGVRWDNFDLMFRTLGELSH
jgi:hypothetical protein